MTTTILMTDHAGAAAETSAMTILMWRIGIAIDFGGGAGSRRNSSILTSS
jgi:hypothetical protein